MIDLLFALLLSLPFAEESDKGWWCETRQGFCYRYQNVCNDESCHWRQTAWVTYWEPDGMSAMETKLMCERNRENIKRKTMKCKPVR